MPVSLPKKKEKTPEFIRSDDIEKEFLKAFNQLTYRVSPYEVWQDFVSMFACALSNPVDKTHYDEREKLYLRTIKKYNGREQKLWSVILNRIFLGIYSWALALETSINVKSSRRIAFVNVWQGFL